MAAVTVPAQVAPQQRGRTTITDRVLARIATRAAAEALAVHTAAPEHLSTPRARATQGRRGTSIRVALDLPYPVDIAAVTREVHQQVVGRLSELAGTEDPRVTLVVARLLPAAPSGRVR